MASKEELVESLKEKPYLVTVGLLGLFLFVVGVVSVGLLVGNGNSKGVEIVEVNEESDTSEVYVDVGGAVISPGLYKLGSGSRVNDALVAAGGLSGEADRQWFSQNMNLAQKVEDGAKIYVPIRGEGQGAGDVVGSSTSSKVSVNRASAKELDVLWGVGPATAEKIISGRPYGSVEELLSKKVVNSNVYERIKDEVSIF